MEDKKLLKEARTLFNSIRLFDEIEKTATSKNKIFYDEVKEKRKGKRMRFQVDNEFQQVKIKYLNDENKAEMLTSLVRGGKAFAAERKIWERKTRMSKRNAQKLQINPTIIIQNSTLNMNLLKIIKYGLLPEEIEKEFLIKKQFRILFNM